jgi:hypothetical protein
VGRKPDRNRQQSRPQASRNEEQDATEIAHASLVNDHFIANCSLRQKLPHEGLIRGLMLHGDAVDPYRLTPICTQTGQVRY